MKSFYLSVIKLFGIASNFSSRPSSWQKWDIGYCDKKRMCSFSLLISFFHPFFHFEIVLILIPLGLWFIKIFFILVMKMTKQIWYILNNFKSIVLLRMAKFKFWKHSELKKTMLKFWTTFFIFSPLGLWFINIFFLVIFVRYCSQGRRS